MRYLARSLLPYLPTLFSKRPSLLPTTFSTTTSSSPPPLPESTTTSSSPPPPHESTARSTTSSSPSPPPESTTTSSYPPPPHESTTILSDHELSDLRHLLPALCDAGYPLNAVRLLDAALLADPPLSSLPLPELVDRLSSLPDMSASMSLLTTLRFHPRRPSPLPFCALIISSYFCRRRFREAAKVFAWLCRADSPCRPDMEIYRIAVRGFCEGGRPLEAVRVAREMARDGMFPTEEIRVLLCLVLLREARIQEGLDFDEAVRKGAEGVHVDGVKELLDRMIRDWEE